MSSTPEVEPDTHVDLTTVEMMSAFGDTWIWTDVTPDQAQEIYKLLGEPTVTRRVGEESGGNGIGETVSGTVIGRVVAVIPEEPGEHHAETDGYPNPQPVEEAVEN